MAYNLIRFAIKYRYVLLAIFAVLSVLGTVYYVRNLQDRIAVAQAELENNRIQQEALKDALYKKERSNAKVKTADFNGLISIHTNGGWLRND